MKHRLKIIEKSLYAALAGSEYKRDFPRIHFLLLVYQKPMFGATP